MSGNEIDHLEKLLKNQNVQNQNDIIYETKSLQEQVLHPSKRKGDNGRFGVVGGSFEYTGAPFYCGMSILLGYSQFFLNKIRGADLSHIYCTKEAAIPIKSYSPDIIVHPQIPLKTKKLENPYEDLIPWLDRMDGFVIGPGLGRDYDESQMDAIINNIKGKFIVGDADFFWMLTQYLKANPDLKLKDVFDKQTESQNTLILTPNHLELTRIYKYMLNSELSQEDIDNQMNILEKASGVHCTGFRIESDAFLQKTKLKLLYDQIQNNPRVIFFIKGKCDMIFNSQYFSVIKGIGVNKRCGGQGDIIAGLSCLYSRQFRDKGSSALSGCLAASYLVRKTGLMLANMQGNQGYKKTMLSLTASDVMNVLPMAIHNVVGF